MRTRNLEREKTYYKENRERILQRAKDKKQVINAVRRAHYQKHKDRLNIVRRAKYVYSPTDRRYPVKTKYKPLIIAHYGGQCECCGESNQAFLTVDHVNNDGKNHRGKGIHRYKGEQLYRSIVKNNFISVCRLLCFNCNIARQNNKGTCPHKINADNPT